MKSGLLLSSLLLLTLSACRKEVEVDVPTVEQKYVVEGRIEQGRPPLVLLTRTTPYFAESDAESFEERFVHDADISVSSSTNSYELQELCSSQVPDSLLGNFVELSGLDEATLQELELCVYSNPALIGKAGESYELSIDVNGERIKGSTRIPHPIPLDSAWFEVYGEHEDKGFAWARIDDPASRSDAYRWYAKRINKGADGKAKDRSFIAPMGSIIDDRFFDGKEFEVNFARGETPAEREPGEENSILYEHGDTIAVKFTTITKEVYRFYRTLEEAQLNAGSPFAQPTDIESNLDSALGVWAGFGVHHDTIVARE